MAKTGMAGMMTTKETADKWNNFTAYKIARWCREGKIPNAVKGGNGHWNIPRNAKPPNVNS